MGEGANFCLSTCLGWCLLEFLPIVKCSYMHMHTCGMHMHMYTISQCKYVGEGENLALVWGSIYWGSSYVCSCTNCTKNVVGGAD